MRNSIWKLDDGFAAPLLVTLLALVMLGATGLGAGIRLATNGVRAQLIADGAAIAAADTLSGIIAGYPCKNAEEIAQVNGTDLIACRIVGSVASVSVGNGQSLFYVSRSASAQHMGG